MVDLVDINTNDLKSTKYSITFFSGHTKAVTKEFLKSSNLPCTA